ncbi:MAG: TldD/PmbA family protein, partial [Candidatus Sericytochromatia bacterium]|nr:TldD/PmbA family protein [Candidatus Sericytochromatia bacterium]
MSQSTLTSATEATTVFEDQILLGEVLDAALTNGADFAEVFLEDRYQSVISYLDGKVKDAVSGKDWGAGVRVFYGHNAIYAYTNDLSRAGLLATAEIVAKAGSSDARHVRKPFAEVSAPRRQTIKVHPLDVPKTTKVALLAKADVAARAVDPQVTQVDVSIAEKVQRVRIANSEGIWAADERPYIRFSISVIASDGKEQQTGSESPGSGCGYEFAQNLDVEDLARKAVNQALTMLKADYAPSGNMPVVIDNGFGGVIFHEACGHLLETTSVAKGASRMCGKLGQPVANSVVTAVDDGTIEGSWGSITLDDEGMAPQKTVLIENGILKSYMVDQLGGKKTGYAPTGCGRRESYKYPPTSRMRNTYIAAGESNLGDMIASVSYGLYAKKRGGGSVSPGTGDLNFAVTEGYMIRDGKIAEP